jgi:hypothetical protein
MELLLVLVLLVIAGSLTIPAITGAFSSVRLRRAGDAVVARFAEARTQAIETGMPYQFRFTPETGKYRLEPWRRPRRAGRVARFRGCVDRDAECELCPPAATRLNQQDQAASNEPDTPATHKTLDETPVIETVLPESDSFPGGQSAVNDAASGERRVNVLQDQGGTWSQPILFFPDGSSSQATVVLRNDVNLYLRVTLRSLTGVARASAVMTREELDQSSQSR